MRQALLIWKIIKGHNL